ncbi:MAG: aldehyde dehydrogenase family protein [Salinisphaera sp.]|nr:aldehyde dehydrogenase family protein [Salinisphaera sp.]
MEVQARYGHFIGGDWLQPAAGDYLESRSPHDDSLVTHIAAGSAPDVDAAVAAAQDARRAWGEMRPLARGRHLTRLAQLVREHIETLAMVESTEMGMPGDLARMLITGVAEYLEYYGGLATSLQGEQIPLGPNHHVYTIHEPYGVVGVITPWNAPLNQAARDCAPALAVGNCVIHKPSEHSSVTALMMAQLAIEAGVPAGVYNVVTGLGPEVGSPLVAHPQVAKIAFTGSVPTGIAIARRAAEKIMPVTLELGGKSPDIIFDDADLGTAVQGAIAGFVLNSGQVCSAGTRVLVQRTIHDQVAEQMAAAMPRLRMGRDATFPCLGPVANRDQYDRVLGYFEVAKHDGARLLTGGARSADAALADGFYIQPTLYGDVGNDMRIAREEIFGPVGVLIPFEDEEQAIAIANDSEFGLVAGLWTENLARAHRVAARLQAGQVFVNHYGVSPIEAPFGGYKRSGIGREKGISALKQNTQIKSVTIKLGG